MCKTCRGRTALWGAIVHVDGEQLLFVALATNRNMRTDLPFILEQVSDLLRLKKTGSEVV